MTTFEIPGNLRNLTDAALDFLKEWFDGKPYITAHTSGSTGAPKEIQLLKSDMLISAGSTNRFFNITNESTLVCPLSANYIAGKMMIVRALVSGAMLYMEVPSNEPLKMDYGAIDLIALVPSQLPSILKREDLRIKNILAGGAQLPDELAERVMECGINTFVSYGMTETCSHVALRCVGTGESEIYTAMPDISFEVDDRSCLVVKSEERSFKNIVTNDIVNLIDNCHFRWIGRYDNVINSGGIKVFPELIEKQIQSLIPDSIEYYVAKCNDKKWGEVPILVLSEDVREKEQLLCEISGRVNNKAERPNKVVVTPIKHTASGKIIRETF